MLSSWHDLDFNVFKNSKGENIEFRHSAKICICESNENKIRNVEAHDVFGTEWVNVSERKILSQVVIEEINKIK